MSEKERPPSLDELTQKLHKTVTALNRIETVIFPSLDQRRAELDPADKHFVHKACQLGLVRVALFPAYSARIAQEQK